MGKGKVFTGQRTEGFDVEPGDDQQQQQATQRHAPGPPTGQSPEKGHPILLVPRAAEGPASPH
jgi:hypothetical protein